QSQGKADPKVNRIVGNLVTGLNNVDGIVNAENNWWGCNEGPGMVGCDSGTGTADFNPWLVLNVSASPNPIPAFGNSTVTGDMTDNSDALDTTIFGTIPLTPVAWSATQGTMAPPTGTTTTGMASSTFTSTSNGPGTGCAMVDNELTCTNMHPIGPTPTMVSGPIGGPGTTMQVAANNVTIAGFTITRAGNNTTDWNNPGLNTAGISVQGQAVTGMLVRDNIVTGNRTGIDVNNSNGHV